MTPFTVDQLIVVSLIFLLGLLIGMFLMAGGKWRRAYREEAGRVVELEAENAKLREETREMDSLRRAAVKSPAPRTGRTGEPPRVHRAGADRY